MLRKVSIGILQTTCMRSIASLSILVFILITQLNLIIVYGSDGLGLDEAGGWWVSQGHINEVITKALLIQGQTPLPYLLQAIIIDFFGDAEFVLRLPSHIAISLSTLALYLVAKNLFSPMTAAAGTALFGLNSAYLSIAFQARPYSIAILVSLFLVGVALRAIRDISHRLAIVAGVSATLLVYLHFIFIPFTLSIIAGVMIARGWDRWSLEFGMVSAGSGSVLLLPCLPQLFSLMNRRNELSITSLPQEQIFQLGLMILLFVAAVIFYVLRYSFSKPLISSSQSLTTRHIALLLLCGAFIQPIALLGFELITGVGLFVPRYYLCSLVPACLLFCLLLDRFSESNRLWAGSLVTCFCFLNQWNFTPQGDGFKEAGDIIERSGKSRQVLVASGFIESAKLENLKLPHYEHFFLSPIKYYLPRYNLSILPIFIDSAEKSNFIRAGIRAARIESQRFWVIMRRTNPIEDYSKFSELAASEGCTPTNDQIIRQVRLVLFECAAIGRSEVS